MFPGGEAEEEEGKGGVAQEKDPDVDAQIRLRHGVPGRRARYL